MDEQVELHALENGAAANGELKTKLWFAIPPAGVHVRLVWYPP